MDVRLDPSARGEAKFGILSGAPAGSLKNELRASGGNESIGLLISTPGASVREAGKRTAGNHSRSEIPACAAKLFQNSNSVATCRLKALAVLPAGVRSTLANSSFACG